MANRQLWKYIFKTAGICFLFFFSYRLLFNFYFKTWPDSISNVWFALRFDLQVCAYLIVIPFILLLLSSIESIRKIALIVLKAYLILIGALLPLVVISDFYYFQFFNERLSSSIFFWVESPGMMLSVVKDNIFYLLGFFLCIALSWLLVKLWSFKNIVIEPLQLKTGSLLSVFTAMFILFVSIRGSLSGPVLKHSDAFQSRNANVNLAILNPIRNFAESLIEYRYDFFNEQELTDKFATYFHSVAQHPNPYKINRPNIVLILIESLSADIVNEKRDGRQVMPFLHSLKDSGIYFDNAISSGAHTFNGIYATLTAFPSLPGEHSLVKNQNNRKHFSFQQFFKENGYYTSIFTTHDKQWDNIYNFFKTRGTDTFIDQFCYPLQSKVSDMGVSDAEELGRAINLYNSSPKPFFSTVITISTHGPHLTLNPKLKFPARFESVSANLFAYTDSCLHTFFNQSSNQAWFNNTLFIITGDHGFKFQDFDQHPLMAYHHIPAFIFGAGISNTRFKPAVGQMDLLPTAIGLTNLKLNNPPFLGRDVLSNKNNYAVFVTSEGFGCIHGDYIVYLNRDGEETPVDFTFGYKQPHPKLRDSMIEFAQTAMQLSKKGGLQ